MESKGCLALISRGSGVRIPAPAPPVQLSSPLIGFARLLQRAVAKPYEEMRPGRQAHSLQFLVVVAGRGQAPYLGSDSAAGLVWASCWFVAAQLARRRIASSEGVPGSGL